MIRSCSCCGNEAKFVSFTHCTVICVFFSRLRREEKGNYVFNVQRFDILSYEKEFPYKAEPEFQAQPCTSSSVGIKLALKH